MYNNNINDLEKMGKNGRNFVINNFSTEKAVSEFEKICTVLEE